MLCFRRVASAAVIPTSSRIATVQVCLYRYAGSLYMNEYFCGNMRESARVRARVRADVHAAHVRVHVCSFATHTETNTHAHLRECASMHPQAHLKETAQMITHTHTSTPERKCFNSVEAVSAFTFVRAQDSHLETLTWKKGHK